MKFLRPILLICAFLAYAPVMQAADTGPTIATVAETIESGGYVYLRLEESDIWIAANTFAVSKGDVIQYSGGTEMKGFYSKTLDRTFESVFFVSSAGLASKNTGSKTAAASTGHKSEGMPMPKRASVESPAPGEITALKDGKTVAAIYAESGQLKEQTVSLNARVMKVNKKIMGKNWITLQDGTGTEPGNKLLVTSQEVVSPGDMVIARGIVKTDIDLGYGYKYEVLLEETTFSPGFE